MPLTFVDAGGQYEIKRIGGKEETRKFLEKLGFTIGGIVRVISKSGGNIIISIKNSRVAISKDLAGRIMV
ncbi:MAG: ferrous iron transport protein A [Lachnospiraceae bacterium]|jgi:Fe2+ transport system protein A|nr:ferrous iron transport protein A [Lachnospiraceae bacterium]